MAPIRTGGNLERAAGQEWRTNNKSIQKTTRSKVASAARLVGPESVDVLSGTPSQPASAAMTQVRRTWVGAVVAREVLAEERGVVAASVAVADTVVEAGPDEKAVNRGAMRVQTSRSGSGDMRDGGGDHKLTRMHPKGGLLTFTHSQR